MDVEDELTVPVVCTKCGKKSEMTLARLKSERVLRCSCTVGPVRVMDDEEVERLERAFEDLAEAARILGWKGSGETP